MVFKNKSLSSFNATLLSKGVKQKPKNIYTDYGTLPGSSVTLYEDTGHYEPYERPVEILFKDPIQEPLVNEWLNGAGELLFDGEEGYYKARVLNVVSTKGANARLGWYKKTVVFEVQPFLFLHSGNNVITITNGQTVINPGIECYPYVKITGSGAVTIQVNGEFYPITLINQYVEIEHPFAWKDTINKGKTLTGGFFKFKSGENVVSWTGNVTKFEIKGRWRTL